MLHRLWTPRAAIVGVVALVVAAAAYGFASANTVPANKAGSGSGQVSGFTVSAIKYTLDTDNPQQVANVTFTVAPAPAAGATVKIKLVAAGSTWFACALAAGNVTCATAGASALTADQLRVVAVQ
jgi:hypothetical protein